MKKLRKCLNCDKAFKSSGKDNRVCSKCKRKNKEVPEEYVILVKK